MTEQLAEDLCISTKNLLHILRELFQVRAQDLDKGQIGKRQILIAAAIADLHITAQSERPDFMQQPRLPNASISWDEHHPRVAGHSFLKAALYPGQLLSATNKGRGSPYTALGTPFTIEPEWPVHATFPLS